MSIPDPQEFTFDAFISYSGSTAHKGKKSFDREMAEALLKALEGYRAPGSLAGKSPKPAGTRRRLKKVFLDREEMQASSSLHKSLLQALEQSRFLIVVCSPRAKGSRWVNEEIALFKKLRGAEAVLTVLIEGEPEEAFPDELLAAPPGGTPQGSQSLISMPLAADVRADSRRLSRRMLRRERLRLLAPMLDCTFDDLRQREHHRFVKRLLAAGTVLSLIGIALFFLSVSLFLSRRQVQRNYALALEADARILPLVVEPLEDLPRKETYLLLAIDTMDALCKADRKNVRCLENLEGLKGALFLVQTALGKTVQAEGSLRASKELIAPIAIQRLQEWDPDERAAPDDLFSELPDTSKLERLRGMLNIWERGVIPRVEDAVIYAEFASEYLEALDTTNEDGRNEARRVLNHALQMLEDVRDPANLNDQHRKLHLELQTAIGKLGVQ